MREPGSDGNLNLIFFLNFQIICLMTLLIKGEEGQTLNDLVFLVYCQEHCSSFYMEFIRKHDEQRIQGYFGMCIIIILLNHIICLMRATIATKP